MDQISTPLPASKAFGQDERSVLLGYLAFHRAVLARKLDGLTDEQARTATVPPSAMTLLGIVRHMTDVERWWFRRVLTAEVVEPLFEDDEEWHVPADATVSEAMAAYWAEIATVDAVLATRDMDAVNTGEVEMVGQHALRRTVTHMIEEYARHCGHADFLREAIDGRTGD